MTCYQHMIITFLKIQHIYMYIPVIQLINSFLDNDYISFLIYQKRQKESKSVSARFMRIVTGDQNSFTNCTVWSLELDAWKVILISPLTV